MSNRPKDAITRYKTVSRLNHWLTALCFVLLTLSGLAMFHPYFFSLLSG
jgi:formate dehydrogenase subunit gamma